MKIELGEYIIGHICFESLLYDICTYYPKPQDARKYQSPEQLRYHTQSAAYAIK